MRRLLSSLVLAIGFILVASPALAQTSATPTATATVTAAPIVSISDLTQTNRNTLRAALQAYQAAKATDTVQRMELIQRFITAQITTRTTAVTKMEDVFNIGRCKNVDATAKTDVLAQLTAINTNLTTEQQGITTLTTVDEAKTLSQDVIQSNRVFVIAAPAVYGTCASQTVLYVKSSKIDPLVIKLKAAGKDTTAMETDLNLAVTDATAAYTSFLNALKTRSTTPIDLITTGKSSLTKARNDLTNAASEAQKLADSSATATPTTQ
ncbi:MAG TPA: hypothetical protein VMQ44_01870 [Candidatus Saccharimonadales bacterium]|nr:hypothetical protein [Candidatus Saccharimonadales bacterium]